MKKIVFIGGFGYRDIGDESMLTADLMDLRKLLPDTQFLVLSPNPEYTASYHRVPVDYSIQSYIYPRYPTDPSLLYKVFRRAFPRLTVSIPCINLLFNANRLSKGEKDVFLNGKGLRFLLNLKSADLVFCSGGGFLNSTLCRTFYMILHTFLICKILGKPVVVSGQTVGPINRWVDRKFSRFVLNKLDAITSRDTDLSRNVMARIGVDKPIIKDAVDDSISLPPLEPGKLTQVLLREGIEPSCLLIGISIHRWLTKDVKRAYQLLARIADYLISERAAKIVFIPMQYKHPLDDRAAISEVVTLMKYKNSATTITTEYDDRTLKGIIGMMDLAIGTRYHFSVFATTMQVPSIGIILDQYYSMKVRGILQMMGQEHCICNINEITFEGLKSLVEEVLSEKEQIRNRLREHSRFLEERKQFIMDFAAEILNSRG